jgi:RNA polymerase sigma factor (sigma-70 family)
MVTKHSDIVLRRLHELVADTDEQLLARFATDSDEAAFASLVERHGPLVLGVCRRVLHNEQDAEDAFQATFLVLARKAGTIDRRASLGRWLYRVAYHMALKARKQSAARKKREARQVPGDAADLLAEVTGRELIAVFDEELQALPECERVALVLCYLESKTRDEAAREAGCSESTLKRRLERGKERMRARLSRRGVALPAALFAAGLAHNANAAAVPGPLAAVAVKSGALVAAGKPVTGAASAKAVALAGTLRASTVGKVKAVGVLLVIVALLGVGAGLVGSGPPAAPEVRKKSPAAPAAPVELNAAPDEKEMTVTGRVLGADGKPLPAARVAVLAGVRKFLRSGSLSSERVVLGVGKTDDEGRFSLNVARTSSARNWGADVLAAYPDCGLGWESFDPDAERPAAQIRLGPEQVIRGQLQDIQGEPAAGVKLQVAHVARVRSREDVEAQVRAEKLRAEGNALVMRKDVSFRNDEVFLHDPPDDLPLWPAAVTTDDRGRFVVRGVGRGMSVSLYVRDDRFAFQSLEVADTSDPEQAEKIRRALDPARALAGRVTYADTGRPAANVELMAWGWGSRVRTDREGRYRLSSARGPHYSGEEKAILMAFPPEGEPYCNMQKEFQWPKGAVKHTLDLELPRGVLVRGKVTDESTGKPVEGAQVRYFAQLDNPNVKAEENGPYNFANGRDMTATDADGIFRIAARPGAGYLLVEGPDAEYVLRENGGQRRLFEGKRGGQPWRSHGFVALDFKPGAEPVDATVSLRKGVTISGEVTGPEGRDVGDLQVFCRLEGFNTHPVKVRGSRFELHGCDPEEAITVLFFDAANNWGAAAKMSAKDAGGKPARVRLAPCGSAQARFLDKEGKPLGDFYPGLFLVLADRQGDTAAQTLQVAAPFRKLGPHTDADGYCTFSTLIPGATYQFGHAEIKTTFTAEPDKILKVPDIVVQQTPK